MGALCALEEHDLHMLERPKLWFYQRQGIPADEEPVTGQNLGR